MVWFKENITLKFIYIRKINITIYTNLKYFNNNNNIQHKVKGIRNIKRKAHNSIASLFYDECDCYVFHQNTSNFHLI